MKPDTGPLIDVALSVMEGLDCAHSLSVAIMLRYGEWDQLVAMRADPAQFLTATEYSAAAGACAFLKKTPDLPTTADLDSITLEKWWWAERECFKTNRRLDPYIDRGQACLLTGVDAFFGDFIEKVKSTILSIIGYGPPSLVEGRFGPGATVSDVSTHVTVCDKMSSTPSLTPGAIGYLFPWTGTAWAKASAALGRRPTFVRGNKYFTVPKDSSSHRACGKEPSLNVFYQLGLGRALRTRLRDSGIDLDSNQNVHKQVACASSKTGEFCTIDLSSASDCVSTALVELLMPPKWARALFDLRSPTTEMPDGKTVVLEKFSSMGNGYTFELETVLFLGIVLSCVPQSKAGKDVLVYGDDIICRSEYGRLAISALKWFGFTPNLKKTFLEGNFRESCGGDFFAGLAVRGHYVKKVPNEPQDYISLANGIRRLAHQSGMADYRRRLLRRAWFKTLDCVPTQVRRCKGPEWLGDLVIHDSEEFWETRWRGQLRYVRVYRPASFHEVRFDGFAYDVMWASALYGVFLHPPERPRGPGENRVFRSRGSVRGYKVGWANCP